jgi:hypothetical protein
MRAGWLGPAVLLLAVVATAGYWAILNGQGTGVGWAGYAVSALILVPALCCALGTWFLGPGAARAILLGWSALTLLALAVIAAASIGLALLPIAVLAILAAVFSTPAARGFRGLPAAGLGGLLGIATVVAFLSLEPFLPPDCPHQAGSVSGTSDYPAGLFTPAVHISWECQDGRLVHWRTSTDGQGSPPASSGSAGP